MAEANNEDKSNRSVEDFNVWYASASAKYILPVIATLFLVLTVVIVTYGLS